MKIMSLNTPFKRERFAFLFYYVKLGTLKIFYQFDHKLYLSFYLTKAIIFH